MSNNLAQRSVQEKVSMALLAVLAVLAILSFVTLQKVVAPAFDRLEAEAARTNLIRAQKAIQLRLEHPPAHYILAIALGHLGRKDEGQAALAKCDELHPGFVKLRGDWQPYVNPASNERFREGLRLLQTP